MAPSKIPGWRSAALAEERRRETASRTEVVAAPATTSTARIQARRARVLGRMGPKVANAVKKMQDREPKLRSCLKDPKKRRVKKSARFAQGVEFEKVDTFEEEEGQEWYATWETGSWKEQQREIDRDGEEDEMQRLINELDDALEDAGAF
ncbi:MAG: hypothetical protein Q9183_006900 [Haloplaca sp. 2 TL-2023]